jgi:hypothetical protein
MSRRLETCQHHQASGLSGPGRSQHGQELAPGNVQIKVFDDQRFTIVTFLHAFKADSRTPVFAHVISLYVPNTSRTRRAPKPKSAILSASSLDLPHESERACRL